MKTINKKFDDYWNRVLCSNKKNCFVLPFKILRLYSLMLILSFLVYYYFLFEVMFQFYFVEKIFRLEYFTLRIKGFADKLEIESR